MDYILTIICCVIGGLIPGISLMIFHHIQMKKRYLFGYLVINETDPNEETMQLKIEATLDELLSENRKAVILRVKHSASIVKGDAK